MRQAGHIIAEVLALVRDTASPGMTTKQLDDLAGREIRARGAIPSFLGYQGFPAHICASVNDEIVHGIPGPRVLAEGDIVSIDCGTIVDGYHGDSAITFAVGEPSQEARNLIDHTRESLIACIAAAQVGSGLYDLTKAIHKVAEPYGYGVIRGYGGHGIGTEMHENPWIPNNVADFDSTGRRGLRRLRLRPGMTIALEPMLTMGGDWRTVVQDDDWTVSTIDGSLSAHWEHTIVIREDGPEVLTSLSGQP